MKVTIITVCRNAESLIEETIKSVLGQKNADIEYIIIDGKSTDKTLSIARNYSSIKIVSESDKGIYDAMNKGVARSTGEIICFMNAGDKFHSENVIENVVGEFRDKKIDGLFGDVYLLGENGAPTMIKRQKSVNNGFLMHDSICHQSMLAKRGLFKKFGGFDLKYPLAADFEWFLRMTKKYRAKFAYANLIVADYQLGGFSSDKTRYDREHKEIIKLYYSPMQITFYKLLSKFNRFSKFYQKI